MINFMQILKMEDETVCGSLCCFINFMHTVPKSSGKVRVIRHSDHGSSPNKPDFSVKINA
jgi:hypothetical protein